MGLLENPAYRRPRFILGTLFAVALLGWFGWFVGETVSTMRLIRSGRLDPLVDFQTRTFEASVGRAFAKTVVSQTDLERLEQGVHPSLGNPKAVVHIVEFVDYGCPYCKKEAPLIREFMSRHMDDAELVIRDFPITELHPYAEDAARAANCVFAQGDAARYWRYYDRLYASQEAQSPSDLRTYAQQVGMDMGLYDVCIQLPETTTRIKQSIDDGLAVGVQGTPTFFFNGVKIQGAIDAVSLEAIFRQALKLSVRD